MYNMMQEDYYKDWIMKKIEWVEDCYKRLFFRVQSHKKKLLGVNTSSQKLVPLLFPLANLKFALTTPTIPLSQLEELL